MKSKLANALVAKALTGVEWHFQKINGGNFWRKWIGNYCINFSMSRNEVSVYHDGKRIYHWRDDYAMVLAEAWDSIAYCSVGTCYDDDQEKLDIIDELLEDDLVITDDISFWLTPKGERFYQKSGIEISDHARTWEF